MIPSTLLSWSSKTYSNTELFCFNFQWTFSSHLPYYRSFIPDIICHYSGSNLGLGLGLWDWVLDSVCGIGFWVWVDKILGLDSLDFGIGHHEGIYFVLGLGLGLGLGCKGLKPWEDGR